MCEYCQREKSHQGIMYGKEMPFKKTAVDSNMKDIQVWLHDGEAPCMMAFDRAGRGAYVDVNYCPMCGRDLRNKKSDNGWSPNFDLEKIPADMREKIRERAMEEERAYCEMVEKYKAHLREEIDRMKVEIGNAETHRALASVPKPVYAIYPGCLICRP